MHLLAQYNVLKITKDKTGSETIKMISIVMVGLQCTTVTQSKQKNHGTFEAFLSESIRSRGQKVANNNASSLLSVDG